MSNFSGFASFVLAATIVSALSAETHCPGNVASVPFRIVNRYQIMLAVSINHSGPYNFTLDTGTEITTIHPSLAAELHLNTQGPAEIVGAGLHESASLVQLDQIEAGSHSIVNKEVMVYDFDSLGSSGLRIRGILGEEVRLSFVLSQVSRSRPGHPNFVQPLAEMWATRRYVILDPK